MYNVFENEIYIKKECHKTKKLYIYINNRRRKCIYLFDPHKKNIAHKTLYIYIFCKSFIKR